MKQPDTFLSLLSPADNMDAIATVEHLSRVQKNYTDSTHWLWQAFWPAWNQWGVLKVCVPEQIAGSPFWQGMAGIFGFSLPQSMASYKEVYAKAAEWSPLQVPALLEAASAQNGYGGWFLTQKLDGQPGALQSVSNEAVRSLSAHIKALHSQRSSLFGPLYCASLPQKLWPERVLSTLEMLAGRQRVDLTPYDEAILAFKRYYSHNDIEFVPIMPDLRWDQFLFKNDRPAALIDLDALVWGAPELEWVLLEYLLDEKGAEYFKQQYEKASQLAHLDAVRTVYRLLLFVMHVLGETSLSRWLAHPPRFAG
ncbi:MAG: hypothetical protein IE937_02370 [Gammaproteobacteria bacterium]|nr:hypothetical protein [Gammaproteobacteria bacterium]MBD3776503.1 hypothetical protein [Thiotrichales bacterium]